MIRIATDTDADAIAALSGQLGYPTTPAEVRERLRVIRARGDSEVFVNEEDTGVVGWVHIAGAVSLEGPASAVIAGLVVEERCRGQGIGTRLMAAAESWATATGYATVRVRSNVIREAAHRFYEGLGYRRTKRQEVFLKESR